MAEERETSHLIGSDKVEGTDVYGPDRQKIGSIERVMIEKTSGKVSYSVKLWRFSRVRRRALSAPLGLR